MKKFLLFFAFFVSVAAFSQTDRYGNYVNLLKIASPPKGDGTTNDRVAILNALKNYKSVFIPYTVKGYRIEENLNIPAGCRLVFDVGARFVGTGTITAPANGVEILGKDMFASTLTLLGDFNYIISYSPTLDTTIANMVFLSSDGRLFPQPLASGYDLIQKAIGESHTPYSTWVRDTTAGRLSPANSTDTVYIPEVLKLGSDLYAPEIGFQLVPSTEMDVLVKNQSTGLIHTYPLSQFQTTMDTSGTGLWQLDSANNEVYLNALDWKVGIGTDNPTTALDVLGEISINGTIVIHKPDTLTDVLILGNGGNNLSHTGYDYGYYNTFVGIGAGTNTTTGAKNTFIGSNCGTANTTGYNNTFIGGVCGIANTTGYYNTFIGGVCGIANTTGYCNTFIGVNCGVSNTTGRSNTFVGMNSGQNNTTGNCNTFYGANSGTLNGTGTNNTFVGNLAGTFNTSGTGNTFNGGEAGYSNSTGSWNTSMGHKAADFNTTGNRNVFFGYQAGVGGMANNDNYTQTDSNMTFIGTWASKNSATVLTNSTALGYDSKVTKSNQVVIGDTNVTETVLRGEVKTNGGYSYEDPTPYMRSFRAAPIYSNDFFLNSTPLPWSGTAMTSGSFAVLTTPEENHPGVCMIKSSASANSGYRLITGTTSMLPQPGGRMEAIFKVVNTANTIATFGFFDALDGDSASVLEGYYIWINGTTLRGNVVNLTDPGEATTATSYTITQDVWYTMAVELNATKDTATFELYSEAGTLLWTDTVTDYVSNIGWVHSGFAAQRTTTTAKELIYLDYMALSFKGLQR